MRMTSRFYDHTGEEVGEPKTIDIDPEPSGITKLAIIAPETEVGPVKCEITIDPPMGVHVLTPEPTQ